MSVEMRGGKVVMKLKPKELTALKIQEFRARMHQRNLNKVGKQEATKIADLIREVMLSEHTANDMTDMHLYGGLPFDLVVKLYVVRCVPNMALNRYIEERQAA